MRVGTVTEISLGAPGTLVLEVGRATPLRIDGDDNLVDALEITRRGEELVIRVPETTRFRPSVPLHYRLGVSSLEAVSLASSGVIDVQGAVRGSALNVSLAGSGEIAVDDLAVRRGEVNVAGSGRVRAEGTADALKVNIAGSGTAHLDRLNAESVAVNVAGSGETFVRSSRHLRVVVAGSGDVHYHGNPDVEISRMGSATVRRATRR